MISFNISPFTGKEYKFIKQAINSHNISGDGFFTKKCNQWLEKHLNANKVMLTTSCSSALDMAALLCNLTQNDEVILPSYTFSSTANAFVLTGAKLVFVDIKPDTMNIDEKKIEAAITERTKVICVVHYAGVSCEMDTIMDIARRNNLIVVEDAAQAIMSTYKGKALGTIGDFGCLSFHETKNFSMGEGGALIINTNKNDIERAEILRDKGTDRNKFINHMVEKYTWQDYGASYLPSELNAAYLWGQLKSYKNIFNKRMSFWNFYYNELSKILNQKIQLPYIPDNCIHNAHLFYLKFNDISERTKFISFMKEKNIITAFHFIPLHSSPAGLKFGRFNGIDEFTTKESERLVRLPLYYNMNKKQLKKIIKAIKTFCSKFNYLI